MHDFLNVAFSDVRWLEDMEDPSTSVSVVLNALNAPPPEENQPSRDELAVWLKPFADSAALPRHNAINKWRKSPSVGFDWPQFGESRLSEISAKRLLERAAEYEKIGRVVGAQLDELNAATNLAVTLTPPSSPRESTSDFAEIRIVIASTGAIQNNIKFARKPSELDERRFELAIKKGVRFTPKSRSQVEGFVLLNNSNEIELAVCYISPEVLDTRLLKPLVSECLIRALGLPSLSLSTVPSLLGSWNAALDSISKTDTLDGSDATEAVGKKDWNAVFREYAVQSEAPDPHPRRYDVVMLRLLYCPSIKPGFDKNMTLLTLGKTKECKIN
ncbi:hypothetical protein EV130_110171 [Rhizobium azibense]|uniref:Uncharacterized protein n=2 Tax=Rhizobium azibense TaxID=1136135 RepID=A0A4R3QLB4_9HYPH|nr:hypothetical protein EV130_110171 [Rhizobium azibense]